MASHFARLADLSETIVDSRVGIIGQVSELLPFAGSPDFFHYFSDACDTRAFSPFGNFNNAGGASAVREVAVAKAVGEAVERYCSAIYDVDALPLSSYDAAPFRCVEPEQWALYSDAQYETPGFTWTPFTRSTPVRWVEALDPLSGERIGVPAAMVYMPYYFDLAAGDTPIVQPISTGMACHCTPAEAAITGICEVIERDALMLTWQAMLAPPQIAVETLSSANYDIVKRFESVGSRVTLFEITTDVAVPTVLAVLQSEAASLPALVFAASTALDAEVAVRKSLEELAHTRRYCHAIKSWVPRLVPSPPDHENITDQITHLNFWTDSANAPLADFIFKSKTRVDFDEMKSLHTQDPGRDLERLCEKVRSVGHQALLVDMTTSDVRDLGLTVVRALIPGFHPLFMSYRNRALGGRRLWTVPQAMGHPGIRPATGDNPSPHMYP